MLSAAVCRKTSCLFKNGVAGAESPYRSSAICATASCSGFVRLTASILAWTRGGSPSNIAPARMPGVYAQRLCTMQSQQSIHSPSPRGRGLGIGIENSLYLIKTDFFYKQRRSAVNAERRFIFFLSVINIADSPCCLFDFLLVDVHLLVSTFEHVSIVVVVRRIYSISDCYAYSKFIVLCIAVE